MTDLDAQLKKSDQNLVWLDCEMTGLDPEKERLIEIAIIVTGPQLTPRIEGPVLAIHQSDDVLDQMDKWNKGTHGKSGLIDKVKASTITDADAEEQILAFIAQYVPKGASPLCGNTISQDRRFLLSTCPSWRRICITAISTSAPSKSWLNAGVLRCTTRLKSSKNTPRWLMCMSRLMSWSTTASTS